jgi:outer membrane protein assembly factor BamB
VIWRASVPRGDRDYPKHKRDPYTDPGVAAYSSPIVAEVGGVRQYIQFLQQDVVGIQADDGKFLWRENSSSNEYANCPTPVFHHDYVYSASGWRGAGLVQLVPRGRGITPRLVYANKMMQNIYGGFVLRDGYIYGCSKGVLTCMDFLTGRVAWRNRSVGTGSVVYADGHIYMRGDKGTIALVEATPKEYRERGRFDQPDRSDRPARTYPVVTGGRLYLRDEGVLLCYDVRKRQR